MTMNDMLDRLAAAQRQQRQFVSDASHELRSPLAAIRQHAEVAQIPPDRTSPEQLAETVLAEEANLERLVDDLLLLARSDEGGLGLRVSDVDLDDLALQEANRSNQARVDVDTSGIRAARTIGDEPTLRRAIRNLLDKANRHAAGRVTIATITEHDHVCVTIHDDGPGIPAPVRERVFQRFTRLDGARPTAGGGAGLGLKQRARCLPGGATVALTSDHEGRAGARRSSGRGRSIVRLSQRSR